MTTTLMYMSYVSVWVLVIIYLPICIGIIWFSNKILKTTLSLSIRRIILISLSVGLFLLPTWDAILGKYYLDQFCKKDGGTYINQEVGVGGIYIQSKPREDIAKQFIQRGFEFVEMGKNGKYSRFYLDGDEGLVFENTTTLRSPYTRGFESARKRVGPSYLNLSVSNQFLENISSKERLGGFRNYQMYTRLDKKWEGIGSLSSTRCTDIPKFKSQDHFKKATKYLELLANFKH